MSEGSQVSKVTLCVKTRKWQWVSDSLTDWPRSSIELPGQLKISKHRVDGQAFPFFDGGLHALGAKAVHMENILLPMLQASWTFLESWVILGYLGPFRIILDDPEPFQTILDHSKPPWIISDHIGPFNTILDHFRPAATILNHIRPSWTFNGP